MGKYAHFLRRMDTIVLRILFWPMRKSHHTLDVPEWLHASPCLWTPVHFQSVKALSTKTCFGGRPKILVWLTCVIILQSIFKRTQTWHPVTFDQGSLMSSSVCKPFPAFGCRLKKKRKKKGKHNFPRQTIALLVEETIPAGEVKLCEENRPLQSTMYLETTRWLRDETTVEP